MTEKDRAEIAAEVEKLRREFKPLHEHRLASDIEVFLKAVEFALRHGEFYLPRDAGRTRDLLRGLVADRIKELAGGSASWTQAKGRVVRGYRSRIDGSVQPYGLVIDDNVDLSQPVPLYVWLHGRGDKTTDVHFIQERLTRDGQIKPPGAIVLHPFGRHCLGFKSSGEIDVLEAIEHVQQHYMIDRDRIVLAGFSMGGAGAWHIGAHYTDQFVAISPGAGFAETARYTNLRREDYPASYEQTLWGVYDVPGYARNLFNRPVIAYSGEMDKQIQAARVMEEAFQSHNRKLTHYIGPGMGHQYHPDTLKQILAELAAAVKRGRTQTPPRVSLQTRTLRYNRMDWVEAARLKQHWQDSRIDAEVVGDRKIRVTTQNVAALRLSPWETLKSAVVEIDGNIVQIPDASARAPVEFVLDGNWRLAERDSAKSKIVKRPGLQGPIDDVFLDSFLVVIPTGTFHHAQVENWVRSELTHFQERWRMVFRGELRQKKDRDVTLEDIQRCHLIAWGTPESNSLLARAWESADLALPVQWDKDRMTLGQQTWQSDSNVPVFIYPNPLNRDKYLVVNSGPTFREAHDRTNSLQNPKLPDWAVVDITVPPSAKAPGRIVAADFFNEQWQLKTESTRSPVTP